MSLLYMVDVEYTALTTCRDTGERGHEPDISAGLRTTCHIKFNRDFRGFFPVSTKI